MPQAGPWFRGEGRDINPPVSAWFSCGGIWGNFTFRSAAFSDPRKFHAPVSPPELVQGRDTAMTTPRPAPGLRDQPFDALLHGRIWDATVLSYSFPASRSVYGRHYEDDAADRLSPLTPAQRTAAARALDDDAPGLSAVAGAFTVEGFTNLDVRLSASPHAEVRLGNTIVRSAPTAFAYLPGVEPEAGDVWFGGAGRRPAVGNYDHLAIIHELGHALGLKHPHAVESFPARPAMERAWDSLEFSVMSYRSKIGGRTQGSYTNELEGFPQTWMMFDIAALQAAYGADYTANAGNTVYRWTPESGRTTINGVTAIAPGANRIFLTIWDGGGNDTYDLRAYRTSLAINLEPGSFSRLSNVQTAILDDQNGVQRARGNVFNALLHQDDERSLIENALGGSGDDRLTGNVAANLLAGGGGDDVLMGGEGDDRLNGGMGSDRLLGGFGDDLLNGGAGNDQLMGAAGDDLLDGGSGADRLEGERGADRLNGGLGPDRLLGGFHDDVLLGGADNDLLHGEAGDDRLIGGDGDDRVVGGSGDDQLSGGDGDDMLNGGDDDDQGTGGQGDDRLAGDSGDDLLLGGAGDDVLNGDEGRDRLEGGEGDDQLVGGHRRDQLFGDAGEDLLSGGDDGDRLEGGAGDDRLVGGDGNDVLDGGAGVDLLAGGAGDDVFVLRDAGWSLPDAADRIIAAGSWAAFEDPGRRGGDRISLAAIDADAGAEGDQAFVFALGYDPDWLDQAGRLWVTNVGSNTMVRGTTDAEAGYDFEILIVDGRDVSAANYRGVDFIL